ncbi:MAG: LysR family transcriptional regulator [Nitrospirae bacterium]|nr:LysR family transcriptional regulator [Nitrospirota bacterium]
MEWQQIIGFHHLVKQGSFTRAASASYRTQSALSQQIKKLEDEFQCQLINRVSRKKFILTPAGERFYKFVASLMAEHDKLSDDISAIRGLPHGKLIIAAPFTTLYHLFPEQFKSFLETHPYVELTILDRPQTQAIEMVRTGDIDIAIALESQVPSILNSRRWRKVETVLIVPDKHPLVKIRGISLSDIAGYPLILPPRSIETRKCIDELFDKEGIAYRVIMESGNVELSSRYVEAGIGISFARIASGLNPLRGRAIAFLPLTEYFEDDYLAVVSRRGKSLPSYAEDFITLILKGIDNKQSRAKAQP